MKAEFLGFYNVENLFPPDEIGQKYSGLKHWDQARYKRKINKIARVFELMKHYNGRLPMLIGLAEISDKKVLNDLLSMPIFDGKYAYIHYDSMDERGVDVALLYHKNKIQVRNSEAIPFSFEIEDDIPNNYDTTRDVLRVAISYGKYDFQLFILHLPSKRDKDINAPKRAFILNHIREKIQQLPSNEPYLVCGDFNENPNENNIQSFAQNILKNPFEQLFLKGKFSIFHRGKGLLFDQCLLSPHWDFPTASLRYEKAFVFDIDELYNRDKSRKGIPYRTYAGSRYLGGYSDHFPIIVKFLSNDF